MNLFTFPEYKLKIGFTNFLYSYFSEYSCAIQKDILVHGRLYATVNYLCFYANIFRWETSVALKWKDVNGLTKEKTALVIPNAIQVTLHINIEYSVSQKFKNCMPNYGLIIYISQKS